MFKGVGESCLTEEDKKIRRENELGRMILSDF